LLGYVIALPIRYRSGRISSFAFVPNCCNAHFILKKFVE
jgi:hypothetical protein